MKGLFQFHKRYLLWNWNWCAVAPLVASERLNRTFYGIETVITTSKSRASCCLNRTFYGIETAYANTDARVNAVLIVPFMELKPLSLNCCVPGRQVLIVRLRRKTNNRGNMRSSSFNSIKGTIKTDLLLLVRCGDFLFQFHKRYD